MKIVFFFLILKEIEYLFSISFSNTCALRAEKKHIWNKSKYKKWINERQQKDVSGFKEQDQRINRLSMKRRLFLNYRNKWIALSWLSSSQRKLWNSRRNTPQPILICIFLPAKYSVLNSAISRNVRCVLCWPGSCTKITITRFNWP